MACEGSRLILLITSRKTRHDYNKRRSLEWCRSVYYLRRMATDPSGVGLSCCCSLSVPTELTRFSHTVLCSFFLNKTYPTRFTVMLSSNLKEFDTLKKKMLNRQPHRGTNAWILCHAALYLMPAVQIQSVNVFQH